MAGWFEKDPMQELEFRGEAGWLLMGLSVVTAGWRTRESLWTWDEPITCTSPALEDNRAASLLYSEDTCTYENKGTDADRE